jgi:ATP-dependent helicase/DNAse subunit B
LDDERNAPKLPRGENASKFQQLLNAVFQRITPADQSRTQTQWISWLEDLLDQLDFYPRTDNERDQTAANVFREVLRSLVLVESVTGVRPVIYEDFIGDLFSTLQSKGTHEPFHRNRPELLIARLTEARGIRFKAVAILGLSEGSFPVNEKPDPFLDEELRLALGLEPRLNREQAGLFYQAVTRTNQYLLLTRPYLSADGEPWEESSYWSATKKLFDHSTITRVNPEQPLPLTETASSQELLFEAVRTSELPKRYAEFLHRWQNLQQVREVLHARRAKEANSPYEGDLALLAESINQRYPENYTWSATRLENFSNCPYQFYVSNLLELEARELPKLGLDSRQLGSMLHKILENTYLNTQDRTDLQSLLNSLIVECDREFADAPRTYGFRPSALWQIEQEQLLEKLKETIIALVEFSQWTPTHFEEKFGIGNQSPLTIKLQDESIKIRGVIDRVDRNQEDGTLRVIDYKTGSAHLSPNDLKRGYRLQLPVYALAARDALKLGTVSDGIYWQIMQAKPSNIRLERFSNNDIKGIEVAFETLLSHLERIMTGIRSAEFPPQPPQGGCPDYCPAAQWCWRYTPGW